MSLRLSLQNSDGSLLAGAMFSAACVFPWLNDPSLFIFFWIVQLFWHVGGADILLSS